MKPGESIDYETLQSCLGEITHTAFRKGNYSKEAWEIHKLIRKMQDGDWGQVIGWIIWALPGEANGE